MSRRSHHSRHSRKEPRRRKFYGPTETKAAAIGKNHLHRGWSLVETGKNQHSKSDDDRYYAAFLLKANADGSEVKSASSSPPS